MQAELKNNKPCINDKRERNMKRKQCTIKEFDFSDCVEITGDALYLINGGAEIENSVEAQSLYSYICEGETGRMLCESFTQKIPLFTA